MEREDGVEWRAEGMERAEKKEAEMGDRRRWKVSTQGGANSKCGRNQATAAHVSVR